MTDSKATDRTATDDTSKANSTNIGADANPDVVKEDSQVYQPPKGADETDRADADVDGTSAAHYGANDPALYENQNGENQNGENQNGKEQDK